MGGERGAAGAALVSGRSLGQRRATRAGDADGGGLDPVDPLLVRSLVVVLRVALQRVVRAFLVVVVGGEPDVHPGHEGREVHREGVEDLLVDDAALALDVPPLPVVLAHELAGVVVRPLGDVIAADVEEVRDGSVTAQEGVERASRIVLEALEEALVVLHDVERGADPALEEVVEIARLEDALGEVPRTGGEDGRALAVEPVQILLQVFLGEVAPDVREAVQDGLEVYASQT